MPTPKKPPTPANPVVRQYVQARKLATLSGEHRRAEKADEAADLLIDGILEGQFTLTTAFDAARVAKVLVEIARLDRGQATTITARETPTTPEERLARFHELRSAIEVGETPPALTA